MYSTFKRREPINELFESSRTSKKLKLCLLTAKPVKAFAHLGKKIKHTPASTESFAGNKLEPTISTTSYTLDAIDFSQFKDQFIIDGTETALPRLNKTGLKMKPCLKKKERKQPCSATARKTVRFTDDTVDPEPSASSHTLKHPLFGLSNIPCVPEAARTTDITACANKEKLDAAPISIIPLRSCLKISSTNDPDPSAPNVKRRSVVRFLDEIEEKGIEEPVSSGDKKSWWTPLTAISAMRQAIGDRLGGMREATDDLGVPAPFWRHDMDVTRGLNDAEINRYKQRLDSLDNLAFKMLVKKTPEDMRRCKESKKLARARMRLES